MVQWGSSNLPALAATDEIQFFYLEAPFPFNVPVSFVSMAGSEFNSFVATHCGLGVYDTTTNIKFSIELVALNYTGSLLPTSFTDTSFEWNNEAKVAITSPFAESQWITSRLISITSGYSYQQLVKYLESNWLPGFYYNPVTVASTGAEGVGPIVMPTNSYTFVQSLIQQLGTFDAPLDTFLPPSNTALTYFSTHTTPQVITWTAAPPQRVTEWYRTLSTCFSAAAKIPPNSASQFLSTIQTTCYAAHSYALVFKSANAVYNVSLHTGQPLTPSLVRSQYTLPSASSPLTQSSLNATDIAFIIFALLLGGCGVLGTVRHFFGRKSRLALEQDKMARETVSSILHPSHSDSKGQYTHVQTYPHFPSHNDMQLRDYFYPTSQSWEKWYPSNWTWKWGRGNDVAEGNDRESMSTRQLARQFQQQQQQQQQASRGTPFDESSYDAAGSGGRAGRTGNVVVM